MAFFFSLFFWGGIPFCLGGECQGGVRRQLKPPRLLHVGEGAVRVLRQAPHHGVQDEMHIGMPQLSPQSPGGGGGDGEKKKRPGENVEPQKQTPKAYMGVSLFWGVAPFWVVLQQGTHFSWGPLKNTSVVSQES